MGSLVSRRQRRTTGGSWIYNLKSLMRFLARWLKSRVLELVVTTEKSLVKRASPVRMLAHHPEASDGAYRLLLLSFITLQAAGARVLTVPTALQTYLETIGTHVAF